MNLTIYTDGACRGNPGKSGAGVLIVDEDGRLVAVLSKYLGIGTNNEAEYKALIIALETLLNMINNGDIDITGLLFSMDSRLLVNQMNGVYSVKSPNMMPLYNKAQKLLKDIKEASERKKKSLKVKFEHVRREYNKEADKLANLGIDNPDE